MEFTLGADLKRPYALRAIGPFIITVLLLIPGIFSGFVIADTLAAIAGLQALVYAALWTRRARALTYVTPTGIEMRRFRTKKVDWADIKAIQVLDVDKVASVGVVERRRGGQRNSGGGNKKVAYVKIIRHRGGAVELPAPLVTRDSSDSEFDRKVEALRAQHEFHKKTAAPV